MKILDLSQIPLKQCIFWRWLIFQTVFHNCVWWTCPDLSISLNAEFPEQCNVFLLYNLRWIVTPPHLFQMVAEGVTCRPVDVLGNYSAPTTHYFNSWLRFFHRRNNVGAFNFQDITLIVPGWKAVTLNWKSESSRFSFKTYQPLIGQYLIYISIQCH